MLFMGLLSAVAFAVVMPQFVTVLPLLPFPAVAVLKNMVPPAVVAPDELEITQSRITLFSAELINRMVETLVPVFVLIMDNDFEAPLPLILPSIVTLSAPSKSMILPFMLPETSIPAAVGYMFTDV
jgi:hypothetical protein